MLYVINIGFEKVNAKFFRNVDKDARTVAESAWDHLPNNGDPRKYKSMPYG